MTIKNTFHNTEAVIRAELGQQLTASQTRRASHKLCGVEGCQCGAFERDPEYHALYTGEESGVFLPMFYLIRDL